MTQGDRTCALRLWPDDRHRCAVHIEHGATCAVLRTGPVESEICSAEYDDLPDDLPPATVLLISSVEATCDGPDDIEPGVATEDPRR
ncbi:hypothetical protein [Streptomyces sp. B1I3]|uniref:hypothetical protein n=1 Tax=Streptomyces sp. B1I3 TaxID=3042264 RepID=UPI00278A6EB0|nr:hypothetical protein [Streptomyces sp. B1I3]MDQ0791785.1 hypothetical protein [Streptomyces sp. B1I3]